MQYYYSSVRRHALEILIDSCTRNFRRLSRDILNDFSNTILRNVSITASDKNYTSEAGNKKQSNRNVSSNSENFYEVRENHGLIISHYDVIPLPLIWSFFVEWSDSYEMIPNFKNAPTQLVSLF